MLYDKISFMYDSENDNHKLIKECADNSKLKLKSEDINYVEEILSGVSQKQKEIDVLMSENLKDWNIDRISKILYSILQLAIYEIKFRSDIPNEVCANEAVKLAKTYDTLNGASFVNGILGCIIENA